MPTVVGVFDVAWWLLAFMLVLAAVVVAMRAAAAVSVHGQHDHDERDQQPVRL
ncbi:MAG: hypothetical protein HY828_03575 [Actinobacteria bacterium]|nr:hypothetical protein [Actinomycetota bacterium]